MDRPKLLLINPWIHDFKAFDLWMKPLGLLYLAAILEGEGYDIDLIDCLDRKDQHHTIFGCGKFQSIEIEKPAMYRTIPRKYKRYGISCDRFDSLLASMPEPQAILVTSSMTYWYGGPFEAIRRAREHFPGVPVLLGGIYARLAGGHARAHSKADYVCSSGDVNEVLSCLSTFTGIKARRRYDSFAAYPPPALHLIAGTPYAPFMTSMGCPFTCSYCASSYLYSTFVRKPPEVLFDELLHLTGRAGPSHIAFYDDALLADFPRHLAPLLCRIVDECLPIDFHTPNALHIRYINEDSAALMKRACFKTIRLGFEVSEPSLQKKTGGKTTTADLEKALHCLISAGFSSEDIGVYVMTGLPGLTSGAIEEALHIVHRGKAMSRITEYSPIPCTSLWESFPGAMESTDPLFHNNTYHTYASPVLPFEEHRRLKTLSSDLNRSLIAEPEEQS